MRNDAGLLVCCVELKAKHFAAEPGLEGTQIPMVVGIRVNSVNESIICKDFSGRGNGDEMLPNCGLRQKVYQVIIFCVYGAKKWL